MTQIPLLNGIYADTDAQLRTSYPRNLFPIPKESGIAKGFLRQASGLTLFSSSIPGIDRGGLNWNDTLYRVIGGNFVKVDSSGVATFLGGVGNDGLAISMDFSFDRLAVVSNKNLFYYNGTTLTQVSDPNLGLPTQVIWVDGYFMLTDGKAVYVTNLADPTSINPLKYAQPQSDPDIIQRMIKVRNQPYVIGRYATEVLQDVGGALFPFATIGGAEVWKGAIGPNAACFFMDGVALVGSGRNEPVSAYMIANGSYKRIATNEIDMIFSAYTEATLASTIVESRIDTGNAQIYIHLPDKSLVYDYNVSQIVEQPVWFILDSSTDINTTARYRANHFVWCYDKWIFGDPTAPQLGYLDDTHAWQFGTTTNWQFATTIIYNSAKSGIIHELELIALTGDNGIVGEPQISTQYSLDGLSWSPARSRTWGKAGQTQKRLNWLQNGNIRKWRIQRFNGNSAAFGAIVALEATIEPLKV